MTTPEETDDTDLGAHYLDRVTAGMELTQADQDALAALLAGGTLSNDGVLACRHLEDGREMSLLRMLYTTKLTVGPADAAYYDDGWCYQDPLAAHNAFDEWDGEGEPTGWTRHPGTGRRRQDGDPDKEETYP